MDTTGIQYTSDDNGYSDRNDAMQKPGGTLLEMMADDEIRDGSHNRIVHRAPAERFLLGYIDTACLVINRMVGTGIFNAPQTVMRGTNSTGISLILWFAGFLNCLAGYHVYIEYGLNVPRYIINGVEQSVPRSGGDLNYLQYMFRRPNYKKDTVLLSTVLFGITFICVGNTAGNSINFALRALQATYPDDHIDSFSPVLVRGLAILVATFACLVHGVTRRGGIWLSNIFAVVKILILLLIIFTAAAAADGKFKDADGKVVPNVLVENTNKHAAFEDAYGDANGYARAFLSIIFAYSGFDQPNYVLGEVRNPRQTYPLAMGWGIAFVSLLYMAVNIAFMVVVPKEVQASNNVAQEFFIRTYGTLGDREMAVRIFNSFLAISTLGNIIVMTYTAARVKQEIAKEGFLGNLWLTKAFAKNMDFSLGRFLAWVKRHGYFKSLLELRWLRPEEHSEETPIGALVLHLLSCIVAIFATVRMPTVDAYNVLTSLLAYLITAWFGVVLSLGILILRFYGPPATEPVVTTDRSGKTLPQVSDEPVPKTWTQMTGKAFKPWLSITCAIIYLIGNLYPVVTDWAPQPPGSEFANPNVQWYVVPTLGWALLGLSALWFLAFLAIAKRREHRQKETFVLVRIPEFVWADEHERGGNREALGEPGRNNERQGGLVLVRETIDLSWKSMESGPRELLPMHNLNSGLTYRQGFSARQQSHHPPQGQSTNESALAGTDFAGTNFDGLGGRGRIGLP